MTDPKHVIITRAQPGAAETAERLVEMGITPVLSPMLALEASTPEPDLNLDGAAGLIFTSANGVRFFEQRSDERDLTAWCVGPATEAAAIRAGFPKVRTAHGDADTLFHFISEFGSPNDGHLVHVANAAAAGRLSERLRTIGFKVAFAPLYMTVPSSTFSEDAIACLTSGTVGAILIHSAKGAAAIAAALVSVEIAETAIVAVSDAAAQPLADMNWKRVEIASEPNEDALLAALRSVI